MSQCFLTNCGLDCYGGSAGYADDQLVKTTRGMIRADSVQGASEAVLVVPGADADGEVSYAAAGGRWGNEVSVEHAEGETGVGHADRALAVSVSGKAITVTFGTGALGLSLPPAALDLAAEVASSEAAQLVTATAGGLGTSAAGLLAATNLAGGENDGDYICVGPSGRFALQVNTRKAV